MIESYIILPDAHISITTHKPYEVVKRFIPQFKPFGIIILGDFIEMSSLSAWDMNKHLLMENRRYQKEMEVANRELNYLQKVCKKIIYLEGNHEDRINRYVETHPQMQGILDLEDNLGLRERGIPLIKINELYKIGKCFFTHGMYYNKYNAEKHLYMLGCNIVYGHTHRPQTQSMNMAIPEVKMAYCLGCLCDEKPEYMNNRPSNWVNGFGIFYVDRITGDFNLYPVNIIKNRFIWGGKVWK